MRLCCIGDRALVLHPRSIASSGDSVSRNQGYILEATEKLSSDKRGYPHLGGGGGYMMYSTLAWPIDVTVRHPHFPVTTYM